MREFNRTILIKWNKVWQPADASIKDFLDGTCEVYFKLNGKVHYLAPGQKDILFKTFNEQLPTDIAFGYATDMNKWELDTIIEMDRKKEENARFHRLNNYRINQAVRNARGNP